MFRCRTFSLNSEFVLGQAEKLANRLRSEGGADDTARINRAYRLLFSREPTEQETQLGLAYLQENGGRDSHPQSGIGVAATGGEPAPWNEYAQVLLSSNEFLYIN
jgi:hypothetical protein